jgi:ABC-type nickel/cobalt efflux system permease component RcnA
VWGLDEHVEGLAAGGGVGMALVAALLLGLRHATDPDHLTAVSTLVLSGDDRGGRRAARLGAAWGLGHATTLLAFGLPVLLLHRLLPHSVQAAAEVAVGIAIVALAARLLVRWRRGYLHVHAHAHGDVRHAHPHMHEQRRDAVHPVSHDHRHTESLGRSPAAAFGVGLVHGVGGSAGVGVLLIGAIPQRGVATVALVVFALASAASMTAVSAAFGATLARKPILRRIEQLVPVLGAASLLFGVFYAVSAAGGGA